jgi:putative nucleotidyltransferase with HDIG domain
MRILFVDDEQNVLQGLQRGLRSLRGEFQMDFVGSGEDALRVLQADAPFDMIVSDLRMPGIDGSRLLQVVKDYWPRMFRFALSGGSEPDVSLRTARIAHQYLSKPCDIEKLKGIMRGARMVRTLVASQPLQQLLSHLTAIPSMPAAYDQLMIELGLEEPSIKRVGSIIATDMGMTTKILQLVNSAFFGVAHQVSRAEQAVSLLGLETVKSLVVTIGVFTCFDPELFPEYSFENLGRHCLAVGAAARAICREENRAATDCDAALMAGMLHDAGKLVLATNLPVRFRDAVALAQAENIPSWSAEERVFGSTHAEAGAYVLGIWGLPEAIIRAIAWHHHPGGAGEGTEAVTAAVHCANAFAHEFAAPGSPSGEASIEREFLEKHGFTAALPAWKSLCMDLFTKEHASHA